MMYSHERFMRLIGNVLLHEGGFVNDPDDPGGATNHGISLRFLKSTGDLDIGDLDEDGDIDADDIRIMSPKQAINIYYERFWRQKYYSDMRIDERVAGKLLDLTVNMGVKQVIKLLQRSMRCVDEMYCYDLQDDGVMGPITREKLQRAQETWTPETWTNLFYSLRSEAACFYRSLVAQRPEMGKYLKGWLRRAYA